MNITQTELLFTGKDGEEYKFVPLELSDLEKFVRWVQYKPYRDAIAAQLPEHKCSAIYLECQRGIVHERVAPENVKNPAEEDLIGEEFGINFTSTAIVRQIGTIIGCRRLMELSLEKTYKNWKEILNDEIVRDNQEEFLILTGYYSKNKKDENPQNPNQEG